MTTNERLRDTGLSRRELLQLGAGGLGLGLLGGIGPVPPVLAQASRAVAANPTGNFTIQIQILCDPGNLDQLVRSGGSNVWFVPQSLGGRSCYRVFYGRFPDRDAAQRALATVPAAIRDRNSAVKTVPR